MRSLLKKIGVAGVAGLLVIGTTLVTLDAAQARHWRGGGWIGPAIVGGLALGALAASRPYYGYPAYGYPAYGYYDGGCVLRRRFVGYTPWGRPIFRTVRVCY